MKANQASHAISYGCQHSAQVRELLSSSFDCHVQTQLPQAQGFKFQVETPHSADTLNRRWRQHPLARRIDILFLDAEKVPTLQQPGCLFMDMDSTLISCECIDEIADFMGIKDTIAAITLRAMQGELDFAQSLRERVKLLAGLDAHVLEEVYQQRIRFNQGAEHLITTLQQQGWKIALVSGGFTYFTDKLHQHLKLDYSQANQLEIKNGQLTGHILGDIVDAQSKCQALQQQAKLWGIASTQTVAIGDGANDLPMLATAAMGVAFHAKDKVRAEANYSINRAGLDALLDLFVANERINCQS